MFFPVAWSSNYFTFTLERTCFSLEGTYLFQQLWGTNYLFYWRSSCLKLLNYPPPRDWMMFPPPLTPDPARNITDQKQSKQTMVWIPGQSKTSKASPGRMQRPFQLFCMYSSRPASAWRSADGRASCAVSLWKSEDGKRWNDLYSAYNASRSSEKKPSCLYAYGFFFLSIPAPYLRPRHTCARAIPAPYLRPRVLSQAFCPTTSRACFEMATRTFPAVKLTANDVPGASFTYSEIMKHSVCQLKRWLECRGLPVTGNQGRIQDLDEGGFQCTAQRAVRGGREGEGDVPPPAGGVRGTSPGAFFEELDQNGAFWALFGCNCDFIKQLVLS